MKAMLACSTMPKLQDLSYPKMASYKLDGFRCLVKNSLPYSRHDKLIPNLYVQKYFERMNGTWDGLDGELMIMTPGFENTQSAFMSVHGQPDFIFCVFDSFLQPKETYRRRYTYAMGAVAKAATNRIQVLQQPLVMDCIGAENFYKKAINKGFEGIILRDPNAPYKFGRSTLKQEWMIKHKPVHDCEVTIIGFEELLHNEDTSTTMKDNMVPMDTLGAFVCQMENDKTFSVGTGKGLTAEKRKWYWDNRPALLDKKLTIQYQELSVYGIPRFPRIKGLRPEND